MVPWDCASHLEPYLKFLHGWLLKVQAEMPSIADQAPLEAPEEVKINYDLVKKNAALLEIVFPCRDLLRAPVVTGPRPGTSLLIRNKELLG